VENCSSTLVVVAVETCTRKVLVMVAVVTCRCMWVVGVTCSSKSVVVENCSSTLVVVVVETCTRTAWEMGVVETCTRMASAMAVVETCTRTASVMAVVVTCSSKWAVVVTCSSKWGLVEAATCRRKEEGGGALSFHTPCKESLEQKQMAWPRAQPPTWSWT
jgi:hypothetical protein